MFWLRESKTILNNSGLDRGLSRSRTLRLLRDFTPCVEIGWRLAEEFWGNGYATEGALVVLALALSNYFFLRLSHSPFRVTCARAG